MGYFDDLVFIMAAEIPDCRARIDTSFPDMYTLQLCRRGPMVYAVDRGPERVLPGPDLFWHHPRHHYRYHPGEAAGSWHHYYVTFRGPRARTLLEQGFMPLAPGGSLHLAQAEPCERLFAELVRLVQPHPGQPQPEGTILLERLLLLLQAPPATADAVGAGILQLAEAIRAAPCQEYDFFLAAQQLHVSYGHFRRRFAGLLGRPPHDYLLCCRMQRAAADLSRPGRQVKEAAWAAGYADPAQFSKLFRRQMGLSPRQFQVSLPR